MDLTLGMCKSLWLYFTGNEHLTKLGFLHNISTAMDIVLTDFKQSVRSQFI